MRHVLCAILALVFLLLLSVPFSLAEETVVEAADVAELTEADELGLEADAINQRIAKITDKLALLDAEVSQATGENLETLVFERQRVTLSVLDELFELTRNLHKQQELGADASALRDQVVGYLTRTSITLDDFIDREYDQLTELRSGTDELKGFALVEFEQAIANKIAWVEQLYKAKMRTITELDLMEIPTANHRENLNNRLLALVTNLTGQLRLVARESEAIDASAGDEKLSTELRSKVKALEIRESAVLQAFGSSLRILDRNGIDTDEFKKLLLERGEVSTDLFNPRIVIALLSDQLSRFVDWISVNTGAFFTQAVLFILILMVFRLIARIVSYMILKSFETNRVEVSKLMQEMLLSMSSKGIMFLGILVALSQIGLEISALLTGLGIAGFIVGFALQDSLANFVAGLMILGYRPYDVGDVIEAGGVSGRVHKMSMVSTTILTFDNQTLIVPNNKIWGDVIKNITLQKQRRIDLEFNISIDGDVEKVKAIVGAYLDGHEKILTEPAPTVEFNHMTPYSMVIVVRPWVEKEDFWPVRWEILQKIKELLDQGGIEIPVLNQGVISPPV